MEKSRERGGERISEWKWRERGWERETRVEHSPVVLAPETRWTQRTVPAPLDGSPQPGGGTNLPPLPGNRRPGAAHTLITVRLCCFGNFHVIKRKGKHQRELQAKPTGASPRLCPPSAASAWTRSAREIAELPGTYPDHLLTYSDETIHHELVYTVNYSEV